MVTSAVVLRCRCWRVLLIPRVKKTLAPSLDPLNDRARLSLSGIRDQLDNLLDGAVRETLAMLCEREFVRKDHRRIEMAPKLAHVTVVKEHASFDFAAQPSVDSTLIRDLAASRDVAIGETMLWPGRPSRLHKAHLSMRLKYYFILSWIAGLTTPTSYPTNPQQPKSKKEK